MNTNRIRVYACSFVANSLLRREGRAAAAALLGVRIIEDEARVDERIFPVQRHPVQEHHALGIDEDLNVVEVQDLIGGPRLGIELELVTQAGAAASEHPQAQSSRDTFALEGFANLVNGLGSYGYHSLRVGLNRSRAGLGLLLVVTDGGLDGVFGEHAAVDLHRRQAQLIDDVGVLDFQRFLDGL